MSTSVPAPARIPRPTGSGDPTAPSGAVPDDAPRAAPGSSGLSGTRSAAVVLLSVVLSVAASTAVVAFSGIADQPAPAAVVQVEPDAPAEPNGAVEDDAGRVIEDLDGRRADSLCPGSSYPAVAC